MAKKGKVLTGYPDIIYTKEDGIAIIKMNRPDKMNAFTPEMSDSLYRAVEDSMNDDAVKVMVITGEGRAFCSGADVKAMAERLKKLGAEGAMIARSSERISLHLLMQKCPKPIIGAINGVAAGGGLDFALACDIRIASEQATFGLFEIRRDFFPGGSGI